MLRTAPISPRTPARTPNLESHASPSRSAGGLTFHLTYIHNTARDGTSHRVSSSQLCAEWHHTLTQTDLAAPVLGLLMTEGHLCFRFVDFLLCSPPHLFFLKTRLFCDEQWSSGFVLNLFDFFAKKKKSFYCCSNISAFGGTREGQWVLFILTSWQQNGMQWWGKAFEPLIWPILSQKHCHLGQNK